VLSILANSFGAAGAIVFVGFFAYKIDKMALTVITVLSLALMLYSTYQEIKSDPSSRNGGAS
jgi:hypothetical protein